MLSISTTAAERPGEERAVSTTCPRCGYDQRGAMRTWVDSCPMEGTCSECGLEWRWSEVFRPENYAPRWCVEFVKAMRLLPRAAISTALRSFWPWSFWTQLTMAQPIRWWRLVMYLALWTVCPVGLVYVSAQAGVAIYIRYAVQQSLNSQLSTLPASLQQGQAALGRLRAEWLVRPLEPRLPNYIANVERGIADIQKEIATPTRVNQSYAGAILEAVFTPMASSSSGQYVGFFGAAPYVAPRDLWTVAEQLRASGGSSPGSSGWSGPIDLEPVLGGLALGTMLMLTLPASLVLLPVSRRKAKVRWAHIARVTLYGLPMAFVVIWSCAAIWMANSWFGGRFDSSLALIAFVGIPVLAIIWWAVAIKRYLRMPHGLAIAVLMTILCFLVGIFVISIIASVYKHLF